MTDKTRWNLCKAGVGLMIILTFTPLITPEGIYQPFLWGMPYTLWAGIIDAIILVGLTWLGTRVHPGRND